MLSRKRFCFFGFNRVWAQPKKCFDLLSGRPAQTFFGCQKTFFGFALNTFGWNKQFHSTEKRLLNLWTDSLSKQCLDKNNQNKNIIVSKIASKFSSRIQNYLLTRLVSFCKPRILNHRFEIFIKNSNSGAQGPPGKGREGRYNTSHYGRSGSNTPLATRARRITLNVFLLILSKT